MVDLKDINAVKSLKSSLHIVFDTTHGKDVLKFMQDLGGWYPNVWDSMDTNEIIARDANRRLLGTIRTMLEITPEQIVALANKGETHG